MANELNIVLAESGATVTCQPYQAGAAVGSPISLTEIGTSAVYTGNMTGSAGTYLLAFNDGTENVGVGSIVWSGTAEVPVSTLTTGDLPSVPSVTDIRTELDANSTKLANLDATVSSRLAGSAYTAPTTPPTVVEIRQEIDANSTKLDASVSTRLASTAATDLAAVKAKTDLLNTDRLANVATTNIVGTLLAQANS